MVICALDASPYGRLWEGCSPRPQSRITHLTRINVDNFIFHKVLGKGSFGKVSLASQHTLALKTAAQIADIWSNSALTLNVCVPVVGPSSRVEGQWGIFCSESSEEGGGADG